MSDPLTRFSSRAQNYAKYRPTYPDEVISILTSKCGLTSNSVVADIGSGTGILSKLLLDNGNTVFGIEPDPGMRLAAEQRLWQYNNFLSVNATAETTTLKLSHVDLIVAAQAFHWFDHAKARTEFKRILKNRGWAVLMWNERRVSTPFLREYEGLLLRYGTDYARVRHENVEGDIDAFYSPKRFHMTSVENFQQFDFAGLKGRTRSASYTPEPGDANFEPLFSELEKLFLAKQKNGRVKVEYDTKIYYGHL